MIEPGRYPPDERLPADTYRMLIQRIRDKPAGSQGIVLFSKEGIVAILKAALAAEERSSGAGRAATP